MDGTNKDCTSGQKTRCPSAIPDGFQSPLIAARRQLPSKNITTHRTRGEKTPTDDKCAIPTGEEVGRRRTRLPSAEASRR